MLFLPKTRPLRDYQIQCVEQTLHTLETEQSCYYVLPTGGGKTRVASELIERLASRFDKILFLAHRQELIYQTAKAFQEEIPGLMVGICMAQQKELSAELIVGTIQTVSRGILTQILDHSQRVLCFFDEAHHITIENSYGKMIEDLRLRSATILGCTATPYRSDTKPGLQTVIPTCSFHRSIEDLQSVNYLAKTTWMPIHIDVDYSKCGTSLRGGEKDYNQEDLASSLFPTLPQIVEKTLPLIEGRPTVVFCPNVAMSQALASAYASAMGIGEEGQWAIRAWAVWGDMPKVEREYILKNWKCGNIQIVVNCAILTEGFDYPEIAAIVNVTPTQSPLRYLQMVGRGTRIKSGQYQDCRIIDIVGNANLLETPQIVLPKVLEAVSERDEQIMMRPMLLDFQAARDEEKHVIPHSYKILDPLSRSWIAWGREPGWYYASLGNNSIALCKKDPVSGLWMSYIIQPAEERGKWHKETVTRRPTTLNDCMQHLNHVIAQNGIKKLIDKDAKWRQRDASEKAIHYLWILDHRDGNLARENSWKAGYVGQRITYHQVKHLIERL